MWVYSGGNAALALIGSYCCATATRCESHSPFVRRGAGGGINEVGEATIWAAVPFDDVRSGAATGRADPVKGCVFGSGEVDHVADPTLIVDALVPNNVVKLRSRARVELQDDTIIVVGA